MRDRCAELRPGWKERYGVDVFARAGLSSGDAVVGNMGSKHKYNYTVMGDMVNLASRLEGANKAYGTALMISEACYAPVKDLVVTRELDLLAVKGKDKPVRVYEVFGEVGKVDAGVIALTAAFDRRAGAVPRPRFRWRRGGLPRHLGEEPRRRPVQDLRRAVPAPRGRAAGRRLGRRVAPEGEVMQRVRTSKQWFAVIAGGLALAGAGGGGRPQGRQHGDRPGDEREGDEVAEVHRARGRLGVARRSADDRRDQGRLVPGHRRQDRLDQPHQRRRGQGRAVELAGRRRRRVARRGRAGRPRLHARRRGGVPGKHPDLDFSHVEAIEKTGIDLSELGAFVEEGGLGGGQ
jgi:hypothetical protein